MSDQSNSSKEFEEALRKIADGFTEPGQGEKSLNKDFIDPILAAHHKASQELVRTELAKWRLTAHHDCEACDTKERLWKQRLAELDGGDHE